MTDQASAARAAKKKPTRCLYCWTLESCVDVVLSAAVVPTRGQPQDHVLDVQQNAPALPGPASTLAERCVVSVQDEKRKLPDLLSVVIYQPTHHSPFWEIGLLSNFEGCFCAFLTALGWLLLLMFLFILLLFILELYYR